MSIAGVNEATTTLQALRAIGVSDLPSSAGAQDLSPQDVAALSQAAQQLQTVTALLGVAAPAGITKGSHVSVLG